MTPAFVPRGSRSFNTESCRHLVSAVIEQAIGDFKMHASAGRIKAGKLTRGTATFRRDGTDHGETEASKLLHFFRPGGSLEQWLELGQLEISPEAIRAKLGITQ